MPRTQRARPFASLAIHNNRIQPSAALPPSTFHSTATFTKPAQTPNGSVANGTTTAAISKPPPNGIPVSNVVAPLPNGSPLRTADEGRTKPSTKISVSPARIHRRPRPAAIVAAAVPAAGTKPRREKVLQAVVPPATTTATAASVPQANGAAFATIPNGIGPCQPVVRDSPLPGRTNEVTSRSNGTTPRPPAAPPPASVPGSVDSEGLDDSRGSDSDASRSSATAVFAGIIQNLPSDLERATSSLGLLEGIKGAIADTKVISAQPPAGQHARTETEKITEGIASTAKINEGKAANESDTSNGTLLSVKSLSVVATAPRRVGPVFPDTLDVARRARPASHTADIPGLDYLTTIDQLNVQNRILLLRSIAGCETVLGGFAVRNLLGQRVFSSEQDTNCFASTCLCHTPKHPLNLIVRDSYQREVLRLSRPDRCVCYCFPCCLQVVTVTSPPWGELGSVHHEWSLSSPQFAIKDSEGRTKFRIVGPVCMCNECQQGDFITFPVTSEETGQQIGRISRPFPRGPAPAGENLREPSVRHLVEDPLHTAGQHRPPSVSPQQAKIEPTSFEKGYSLSFNKELPVAMKAVLIAAVFLIDFLYRDLKMAKLKSK